MSQIKRLTNFLLIAFTAICFTLTGCNNNLSQQLNNKYQSSTENQPETSNFDLSQIPSYTNNPIFEYNNNKPLFKESEITTSAYENYTELDELGRVQTAMACLGEETLPTKPRDDISSIKPTGWHSVKYDCVENLYLYNRCHLIAHELAGEDANEKNLLTGTRYMNVKAMLPYENLTRKYIDTTGNHVMYRVTPIFVDTELVCRGLLIEAYSVEDKGEGIQFCIYCYNVQPNISIDYQTGSSQLENPSNIDDTSSQTNTYVLNTNSKTIHIPDCSSVSKISANNKQEYTGSLSEKLNEGYKTCGICKPE